MSIKTVSMKKGGKKAKHGRLRSVTISRAQNGFQVSKDHEPMTDQKGNYDYSAQNEPPTVFSGDDAAQQAHDHSMQAFAAEPDADESGAADAVPAPAPTPAG